MLTTTWWPPPPGLQAGDAQSMGTIEPVNSYTLLLNCPRDKSSAPRSRRALRARPRRGSAAAGNSGEPRGKA